VITRHLLNWLIDCVTKSSFEGRKDTDRMIPISREKALSIERSGIAQAQHATVASLLSSRYYDASSEGKEALSRKARPSELKYNMKSDNASAPSTVLPSGLDTRFAVASLWRWWKNDVRSKDLVRWTLSVPI
jgi:hypothetical protein